MVILALPPIAAAQDPPPQTPTFRSSTNLIVQTVTVKDRDGRVIEGLTAPDFVVTEDGKPQDVAFVEFQRIDATRAAAGAEATPPTVNPAPPLPGTVPVITTSPKGDSRYQHRRLVIFYFDAASMPASDFARACLQARTYVDELMAPADIIALMEFKGGAVRVRQDFTDNRQRLRETIQAMMNGDSQDGFADNPETGTSFGQNDAEFNIFNTDRQLSALQTAIAMLRPLPEQKTLIYFASGVKLNGTDNQAQLRATINSAVRSNVTLNPIDVRGLVAMAPLGDATERSPGGTDMFSGPAAHQRISNFERSQDTLFALAKDTGGKAILNTNDLAHGIGEVADTISSYYIVGYYSTQPAKDGKFRRITVAVKDKPQARLSYRQGYFADKTWGTMSAVEKERQLEEAMLLEDPVTDIPIALELDFFQLNRAEYFVPVFLKIPGSELQLAKHRGAQRTRIDFIGEVKDDSGFTQQNVRDKVDIPLTDQEAADLGRRPVQYETGFTLLPGKYVIRLLARDAETGRIGTFQTTFTIPNLERDETTVPISTVVLSSQRIPVGDELYAVKQTTSAQAQAANPLVADGQKLVPSVTRVFSKARDLYVFLQAYQRRYPAQQPVVAFVSLYRGGEKAFETPPIAVTSGIDARKAIPIRFDVSLQALAAGPYQLQVTVLEPEGKKAAFWRAPVVIVP